MPGLRSLVARRRSSLTSPPYTLQRNTPSPSLSDNSDHAVTPHTSEGGESPMTERGGISETQETKDQNASSVHLAGRSIQDTPFSNGETTVDQREECSGVGVGDIEQEKDPLVTNDVKGEEREHSIAGEKNEEGNYSSVVSEFRIDCVSDSLIARSKLLEQGETASNPCKEGIEQLSSFARESKEESFISTEAIYPASEAIGHITETPASQEDSVNGDGKSSYREGTETHRKKVSADLVAKELQPVTKESQEKIEESFGIKGRADEKLTQASVDETDVRKETVFRVVEGCETVGSGDDSKQIEDICMPGEDNVSQKNYNDTSKKIESFSRVFESFAEEAEAPSVAEEGDSEKIEPTNNNENYNHEKTETFCENEKYLVGSIDVYDKDINYQTKVSEFEEYVSLDTKETESSYFALEKSEEYFATEKESENKNVTPYDASEENSEGKEVSFGGGYGADSDGNKVEKLNSNNPVSDEWDPEGNRYSTIEKSILPEINMDSKYISSFECNTFEGEKEVPIENYVCGESEGNMLETGSMDMHMKSKKSEENEGESDHAGVPSRQIQDKASIIYGGETPTSRKKAEGDSQTPTDSSENKNILSKPNQKNNKGGKKCSDLSAMEIESTLASRGVTIVRRVVDNKETTNKGKNEFTSVTKNECVSGVKPLGKGLYVKTVQPTLRGGATSGSGISVSLQPSPAGQTNSHASKDLYRSINARGTHIQTGSKINPALLNRKGSFQLTKGVSIHYNPKTTTANMNVKGNTVYPNLKGAGAVGSRGPRMYANPRGQGVQTPRGFSSNLRHRGPGLPQTRRGTPQTNLRGLAPVNLRGMLRPQRYMGPRGTTPRSAVPLQRPASVPSANVRGVNPQRFRVGINQHQQPVPTGLPPQVKPAEGVQTPKPGETPLQSRSSTTMPPQTKYLKTSPDQRSTDAVLQSNLNTDKMNMPLQSKAAGMSTQQKPSDTLQSPQPGSAEMSPQSRTLQFSPQSLLTGMQPPSEYGGSSAQPRTVERSPQSVLSQSPASATTSQAGPAGFTSQPVSASHPTLASSSHHLPQMNMMNQTSAMGLPPHSGTNRLPPHSVSGGFMSQATSIGSSSQAMPSHIVAADRFSTSAGSAGFPPIPCSEYLGRPGSEMFASFSNPGDYTPHSTTSGFPHMSSGDYNLQSTSGGFSAQTNLVGFPAQNNSCGYTQHTGSGEFSPHNSAGVVGQTSSEGFASHQSCSSFPAPGTPGGYTSIPCTEPYNTPANPATFRENADIFSYPGQRDFLIQPSSREFPHYNSSNHMTSPQLQPMTTPTGHRSLPMNQNSRDLSMQNCNQGLPLPSSGGNSSLNDIMGEQYSHPTYGETLTHSAYQEIPLSARTNPNAVPLAPSFRDSELRQNFRDSATPHYNYRETNAQEGLRASQIHSGYRDLQMESNIDLSRGQSAHSNFKDQQATRYREDGIISRYLEQSVLNYPDTGSLNSCREQPVPSFGSPTSHTSPSEQVMSSCRENINQINFPDTLSDTNSRQHILPGLGEPMNYVNYRGTLEYNSACEQPNPNLQESLNYVSNCQEPSNIDHVAKSVSDGIYKNQLAVTNFNVSSQHQSVEGVPGDMKFKDKDMRYSENAALPSFTESFDHSPAELNSKKEGSSNLPPFRGSSDMSFQRNLPEYTNASNTYESHAGDASASASYSCLSDSKNSGVRESSVYPNHRGYLTPSCDTTYSPGQSCSSDDVQFIGNSGDNFQEKSDFHIPGDSLVPPDKEILEFPVSQGSSITLSTNNTQSDASAKGIPDSSAFSNPETHIPCDSRNVSKISSVICGGSNEDEFSEVGSLKDLKKSSTSNMSEPKVKEPSGASGSDSPIKSPRSCSVDSPEKFPPGMSPIKSDSGSPSTQDRIVIKMKLLHSDSSAVENTHNSESANITDLGLANKSSIKYNLAKYTRWTIDSIINGREDIGSEDILDRENNCEIGEIDSKEERKTLTDSPKRTRRRRNSELCEDSKDTNLDTNKNFMKKSLKITIPNPMRCKVSLEGDSNNDEGNIERKRDNGVTGKAKIKEENVDNVQLLNSVCERSSNFDQESENQLKQYSSKKGRVRRGKSPSPTPSAESCSSTTSLIQPDSDGRQCCRNTEAPANLEVCSEGHDDSASSDVKKCSIVIKRIYTNDNYSCYSSSLCDKKTVLNIDDGTQRRSKRRAAVEASERCHKTLRSLDTNDPKSGKVSLSGSLSKNKDILTVNLTTNKTVVNQIPQCSVLLYDVFMNHRINQMVCPGCSRHYDSTDSVQVNMNKATISLLCSSCQWLVVKDVHPQEVDSLVPS